MSGTIISSEAKAQEKAVKLKKAGEPFALLSCVAQASISNTTPAAQYDTCTQGLKSALGEYRDSLKRDASAIEAVASSLGAADRALASKLLS